jgi:hypothetical protein
VHPSKSIFQRGCVHHQCYTTAQLTVSNVGLKRTNVSVGKLAEYRYKEIPGAAGDDLARMSRYVPSPDSCLVLYIAFRPPPQCYLRRIRSLARRGLIQGHDRSLTTIQWLQRPTTCPPTDCLTAEQSRHQRNTLHMRGHTLHHLRP